MSKNNQTYINKEQNRRLTLLEKQFIEASRHYNDEIGAVKVSIAKIETNQKINLAIMIMILGSIAALLLK